MRKLLGLLLGILGLAATASAQWNYIPIIQSKSNTNNATTVTCPFTQNVTSNNLMVVGVGWTGTTNVPVLTDTLSSTWTQNFVDSAQSRNVVFYSTTLGGSGAETITATTTGGSQQNISCAEMPPNWTLTKDCSADVTFSGSPATVASPTCTTTQNGDLVFVYSNVIAGTTVQGLDPAQYGTWFQIGTNDVSAGGQVLGFRTGSAVGASLSVTITNNAGLGTVMTVAFKSKALAITSPAAAPDGALSNVYNYTVLANGGVAALTWSVLAGSLPPGLALNGTTGAITGTPTSSNNYSATIQATDGTNTATKAMTFKIAASMNSIAAVQLLSSTSTSVGDSNMTFASNVTSGNAILVAIGYNLNYSEVRYCTDSINTTFRVIGLWVFAASDVGNSGSNVSPIEMLAGVAPSGGADTITCSSQSMRAIGEFSNVNYIAQDNGLGTHGNTASPATITSGSLTTLVPNELLWGACDSWTTTGTNVVNSPFTVAGTNTLNSATGYRIVSSVTGYTMSCSQASNTNGAWLIGIVGLRPSGGAVVVGGVRHRTEIL